MKQELSFQSNPIAFIPRPNSYVRVIPGTTSYTHKETKQEKSRRIRRAIKSIIIKTLVIFGVIVVLCTVSLLLADTQWYPLWLIVCLAAGWITAGAISH